MGKKLKIFVNHMNPPQRVTSAEEDFNSQVDSLTDFVDTSLTLPTAILVKSEGKEKDTPCKWYPKESRSGYT